MVIVVGIAVNGRGLGIDARQRNLLSRGQTATFLRVSLCRHPTDHMIPIFTVCPELSVIVCAHIIVSRDYSICLSPKMRLSWTLFDSEV